MRAAPASRYICWAVTGVPQRLKEYFMLQVTTGSCIAQHCPSIHPDGGAVLCTHRGAVGVCWAQVLVRLVLCACVHTFFFVENACSSHPP